MKNKNGSEFPNNPQETLESIIGKAVVKVSSSVQKRYEAIDLNEIPTHVSYAKVEKYLRSVDIEITRKMFLSYIKEGLLPRNHIVKNANYSYYKKEQIIYYILIDMFKPILPLGKIKILFNDILKPMIDDTGIESTYKTLREIIQYMTEKFEEAGAMAIKENISIKDDFGVKMAEGIDYGKTVVNHNVRQYTNLVTLCMARGALDFYKYAPNTLLD